MTIEEALNECVSRDKAIVQLNHLKSNWDEDWNVAIRKCIETIKKLPYVTPQKKMGRWIMSDDGLYRPICNNCGAHPWKGYIPTVEEATESFKYCPYCGCAMQEVENGKDND